LTKSKKKTNESHISLGLFTIKVESKVAEGHEWEFLFVGYVFKQLHVLLKPPLMIFIVMCIGLSFVSVFV